MKSVVILPTYNEQPNITRIVETIFATVPDIFITVVDDNSPDGTASEVKRLMDSYKNLSLINRRGKEGLGKAYISAFQEVVKDSSVKTVIMMDADFSHNPSYLPQMLKERANGYTVVIGSRYVKDGGTSGWELWRRFLSWGGNLYVRLISGMPVKDNTAGFNAIDAELLRKIRYNSIDISGYAFIIELKYLLYKAGAKFKEIPIIFANRTGGESKMSGHIVSEGVIAPWRMIFKK